MSAKPLNNAGATPPRNLPDLPPRPTHAKCGLLSRAGSIGGYLRPSLLTRYLFKQNLYFVVMAMLAGTAVYLLVDLFDRIDNFIDAEVGLKLMLVYFLVKIPMIISQILPAIFLLSTLVQLCVMAKNREYLALQAGGVSPLRLVALVLALGLLWGGVQLFFSQAVGVQGERYATSLWREYVDGKEDKNKILRELWFWNENRAIYLEEVNTETRKGLDVSIYALSDDGSEVKEVIRAQNVAMHDKSWDLHNATVYNTDGYIQAVHQEINLPIRQQMKLLTALSESANLSAMSLWQLGDAIERLRKAGSNLESLRTLWHSKLAYAASVLVMALIAISLMFWRDNVYINSGISLVVVFMFYTLFTLGITAGQKGLLPPIVAVWGGLAVFSLLCGLYILWKVRPPWLRQVLRRLRKPWSGGTAVV